VDRLGLDRLGDVGETQLRDDQPVEPGDADPARRHRHGRHREPAGERMQRSLQLAAGDRALAMELAVVERRHHAGVHDRALVVAIPGAGARGRRGGRGEQEHGDRCGEEGPHASGVGNASRSLELRTTDPRLAPRRRAEILGPVWGAETAVR
jgi:hypothetical protein